MVLYIVFEIFVEVRLNVLHFRMTIFLIVVKTLLIAELQFIIREYFYIIRYIYHYI